MSDQDVEEGEIAGEELPASQVEKPTPVVEQKTTSVEQTPSTTVQQYYNWAGQILDPAQQQEQYFYYYYGGDVWGDAYWGEANDLEDGYRINKYDKRVRGGKRKRSIHCDDTDIRLRAKARKEEERLAIMEYDSTIGIEELDVKVTELLEKFDYFCSQLDKIIRDLGVLCTERELGTKLIERLPVVWDALCKFHALLLTGHRRKMNIVKLRNLFKHASSSRACFLTDKQRQDLTKWADEADEILEKEKQLKSVKPDTEVATGDNGLTEINDLNKIEVSFDDKHAFIKIRNIQEAENLFSSLQNNNAKLDVVNNIEPQNNVDDVPQQQQQLQSANETNNNSEIAYKTLSELRNELIPKPLTKREATLKKLVDNEWKMYLVLDIDFTLLNSAMLTEVPDEYNEVLDILLQQQKGDLFNSGELGMWTKLRPAVHEFLELVFDKFELWLFTNATKTYAEKVVEYLDPEDKYFGDRVICQGGSGGDTQSTHKCLAKGGGGVLEGKEALTLVLDDSQSVWPDHQENLIRVEKYVYFPSVIQDQTRVPYLTQARDECEEEGILMRCAHILEQVRDEVISRVQEGDVDEVEGYWDVRTVLGEEKKRVLQGVCVTFSRIIPLDRDPSQHRYWRMAEEFGAKCLQGTDPQVTHVVASCWGTDKVRWAAIHKRHVVSINWLECCCTLWKRADESLFQVK